MLDRLRKSKTAKGLVGLLSPLVLASGICLTTPKFSHANPVTEFVDKQLDRFIDSIVSELTDGKYKTYDDAIQDTVTNEEEYQTQKTENKSKEKRIYGGVILRDGTILKNVRYKHDEFVFLRNNRKISIPVENILFIDFSKEKNKDVVYQKDGLVRQNVQYINQKVDVSSYLGDMQINQDKIKVFFFDRKWKETAKTLEEKIVKIVYASKEDGDFEIYSMNSNRTNKKKLTDNSTEDYMPVLSDDGKKIAYLSGGKICIMNADGTNKNILQNFDTKSVEWVKWHPDNQHIFIKNGVEFGVDNNNIRTRKNIATVYMTHISLQSPDKLVVKERIPTMLGEKEMDITFSDLIWSPDKREAIVLMHNKEGTQVMVCNQKLARKENLTLKIEKGIFYEEVKKLRSVFEQGGYLHRKKVTKEKFEEFIKERAEHFEELSRYKKLQIFHMTQDDMNLAWSPDGKKIVFTLDNNILTMDKYGGNVKYIYHTPINSFTLMRDDTVESFSNIKNLKWSPDGKKIAFTAVYSKDKLGFRLDDMMGVYIKNSEGETIDETESFYSMQGEIHNLEWASNDKLIYVKEMKHNGANIFTIENGKEKIYHNNFKFKVNTSGIEEILNIPLSASEREVKEYLKYMAITEIEESQDKFKGVPITQIVIRNTKHHLTKKRKIALNYLNLSLPEPDLLRLEIYNRGVSDIDNKLAFIYLIYEPPEEERKKIASEVYNFIVKKYGQPQIRSGQRVYGKMNMHYSSSVWETDRMYIEMGGDFQDEGKLFDVRYFDKRLIDSFTRR